MSRPISSATASGLFADGPPAPAEVRHLAAFMDGAIMVPEVRWELRRHWGLCDRHSWLYTVLEVEARGGAGPFSTAILLEDLLQQAVAVLRRRALLPWALAQRPLRRRGRCFTCDYQGLVGERGSGAGAATASLAPADRAAGTCRLVAAAAPQWRRRACPRCLPGPPGPEAVPCRVHLLQDAAPPDRAAVTAALGDLALRLHRYVRSLTWRGPVVGPPELAAWVEALGWTGGWARVRSATADTGPQDGLGPVGPPARSVTPGGGGALDG
ncbi:MAG TPA: hypothetical protein VMW49_01840 [Candidatus Dormibacteraeota bacterium]|nr:hypothetical protein [Candidatus Dormibacteraeota bacterium]